MIVSLLKNISAGSQPGPVYNFHGVILSDGWAGGGVGRGGGSIGGGGRTRGNIFVLRSPLKKSFKDFLSFFTKHTKTHFKAKVIKNCSFFRRYIWNSI